MKKIIIKVISIFLTLTFVSQDIVRADPQLSLSRNTLQPSSACSANPVNNLHGKGEIEDGFVGAMLNEGDRTVVRNSGDPVAGEIFGVDVPDKNQPNHMTGLRLINGREGLWINGRDIGSEEEIENRKQEIQRQRNKITYNIEGEQVVISEELRNAMEQSWTSYIWLEAYLKELFRNDETRPKKNVAYIDLLDASECLFEDHKLNGYIGINKQLFEIKDAELRIKLLKLGLRHEMRHENGMSNNDISEEILLLDDTDSAARMGIMAQDLVSTGIFEEDENSLVSRLQRLENSQMNVGESQIMSEENIYGEIGVPLGYLFSFLIRFKERPDRKAVYSYFYAYITGYTSIGINSDLKDILRDIVLVLLDDRNIGMQYSSRNSKTIWRERRDRYFNELQRLGQAKYVNLLRRLANEEGLSEKVGFIYHYLIGKKYNEVLTRRQTEDLSSIQNYFETDKHALDFLENELKAMIRDTWIRNLRRTEKRRREMQNAPRGQDLPVRAPIAAISRPHAASSLSETSRPTTGQTSGVPVAPERQNERTPAQAGVHTPPIFGPIEETAGLIRQGVLSWRGYIKERLLDLLMIVILPLAIITVAVYIPKTFSLLFDGRDDGEDKNDSHKIGDKKEGDSSDSEDFDDSFPVRKRKHREGKKGRGGHGAWNITGGGGFAISIEGEGGNNLAGGKTSNGNIYHKMAGVSVDTKRKRIGNMITPAPKRIRIRQRIESFYSHDGRDHKPSTGSLIPQYEGSGSGESEESSYEVQPFGFSEEMVLSENIVARLDGYVGREMFFSGIFNSLGEGGVFSQNGEIRVVTMGKDTGEETYLTIEVSMMKAGERKRLFNTMNGRIVSGTFAGGKLILNEDGILTALADIEREEMTFTIRRMTKTSNIIAGQPKTEWLKKEFRDMPPQIKAELDKARGKSIKRRLNRVAAVLSKYVEGSDSQAVFLENGTWMAFLGEILKSDGVFKADCDVMDVLSFIFLRYLDVDTVFLAGYLNADRDDKLEMGEAHGTLFVKSNGEWIWFEPTFYTYLADNETDEEEGGEEGEDITSGAKSLQDESPDPEIIDEREERKIKYSRHLVERFEPFVEADDFKYTIVPRALMTKIGIWYYDTNNRRVLRRIAEYNNGHGGYRIGDIDVIAAGKIMTLPREVTHTVRGNSVTLYDIAKLYGFVSETYYASGYYGYYVDEGRLAKLNPNIQPGDIIPKGTKVVIAVMKKEKQKDFLSENIGKNVFFSVSKDVVTILDAKSEIMVERVLKNKVLNKKRQARIRGLARKLNAGKEEGFIDFIRTINQIRVFKGNPVSHNAGAFANMPNNGEMIIDSIMAEDNMVIIHEALHEFLKTKYRDGIRSVIENSSIPKELKEKILAKSGNDTVALRHYYARYYLQMEREGGSLNEELTYEIKINSLAGLLGISDKEKIVEFKRLLGGLKDSTPTFKLRVAFVKLIKSDGKVSEDEIKLLIGNISIVRDKLNALLEFADEREKKEAIKRLALYLTIEHLRSVELRGKVPAVINELVNALPIKEDKRGEALEKVSALSSKDFSVVGIFLRELLNGFGMDKIGTQVEKTRKYLYNRAEATRVLKVPEKERGDTGSVRDVSEIVSKYLRGRKSGGKIADIIARYSMGERFGEEIDKSINSIINSKRIKTDETVPAIKDNYMDSFRKSLEKSAEITGDTVFVQDVSLYLSGNEKWDNENLSGVIVNLINKLLGSDKVYFIYNNGEEKERFVKLLARKGIAEDILRKHCMTYEEARTKGKSFVWGITDKDDPRFAGRRLKNERIIAAGSGIVDLYLMWKMSLLYGRLGSGYYKFDTGFMYDLERFLSDYYEGDDELINYALDLIKEGEGIWLILPKMAPYIRDFVNALDTARELIDMAA